MRSPFLRWALSLYQTLICLIFFEKVLPIANVHPKIEVATEENLNGSWQSLGFVVLLAGIVLHFLPSKAILLDT